MTNVVSLADRIPTPSAVDAERALLGAIIRTGGEWLDEVAEMMPASAFYRPDHGRLFDLLVRMRRGRVPLDRVSISERVLTDPSGEDAFGGYAYVLQMPEHCPSTTNWRHYAEIVRQRWRSRTLLRGMEGVLTEVRERPDDVDAVTDQLRGVLAALKGAHEPGDDVVWVGEAARKAADNAARVARGESSAHGLTMPLRSLATIVPVLAYGEVTLIAARPGMGKSALARSVAELVASDPGTDGERRPAVFVLSFEMEPEQVAELSLGSLAGVSARDIRAGRLDQNAWDEVEDALAQLDHYALAFYRGPGLTVEGVASKVRRAKAAAHARGFDLRLVVVDYIQIMRPTPGHDRNNNDKVGHISWGLKDTARSEGVAMLALSQMNRQIEGRADKEPQLSDLRDSGSLEQDAAVVLFPIRPSECGDKTAPEDDAVVFVRKNRYGPTGEAALRWIGRLARFEDRDARFEVLP